MEELLRYSDNDLLFAYDQDAEDKIMGFIAWAGEPDPGFIMARWHATAIKLALDNPSFW